MAKLLRRDLVRLQVEWLLDARTLLGAQRYAGAYHAGGVALECALKARIARFIEAEEFPDLKLAREAWDHDPRKLLALGDLLRLMRAAPPSVQTNWATMKDWTVESRYTHTVNPATVAAFVDALDHPTDGVITWLRNHF
jgi:hypothetical protein